MQFLSLSIVAFVFVLGILVFVHEFGHYAVAKLFKVRVEVFSLGFGKRLIGFRRGDTDYRISLLPLGGYVKMAGENPMEARTGDPGEFMSHPRWQRFLVAIAGPAMNIILAFVVLSVLYTFHHEYLAFSKSPVDVVSIAPNSPAERAGLQIGDRIVKVERIDNPTWEDFLTRVSINPNQQVPVKVLRGDKTMDLTLVPETSGKDREGSVGLEPPEVVGMIEPGLPADKAHIQSGDVLVSVDGKPIHSVDDLLKALQGAKGSPVQLTILRDRKNLTLSIPGEFVGSPGSTEKKYRIGVSIEQVEKLPFPVAVQTSYEECKSNALLIFELLGKLVQRKNSIQQMSGPIGIMRYSGQAARMGMPTLLKFMALISLNLAIFNLLPIPILDGGLVLMLLVESVMRRDIKQEVKERVYQAAFVFLVLFAAVVIFNDVAKTIPSHTPSSQSR
ncbi:MAG TPA: site-2 protease family protein [Candidatus Angelobacter sp.]|nr:site-2 protease family protein [Candidatus Angelobacter sp.]